MKKNIVVCVTGGIAAYKAADLVSKLSKEHNVRVLMTRDALQFVGSETFKILSKMKFIQMSLLMKISLCT